MERVIGKTERDGDAERETGNTPEVRREEKFREKSIGGVFGFFSLKCLGMKFIQVYRYELHGHTIDENHLYEWEMWRD